MAALKAIVLSIIGMGLILAAIVTGLATREFLGRAARAPGVVSRLNAGGSHPEIEFTLPSGETVSYPQGGFIFGYKPGQRVQVLYAPEDPGRTAPVEAFGALWFVPVLLSVLGLALLVGGVPGIVAVLRAPRP
jgi:hypothetical protein